MKTEKITLVTVVVVLGFAQMPAYGDHVDMHIWLETAEGNFITATDKAIDKINDVYYPSSNPKHSAFITHTAFNTPNEHISKFQKINFGEPQATGINDIRVIDQRRGECGDKTSEVAYFKSLADFNTVNDARIYGEPLYTHVSTEIEPDQHKKHHEHVCGYWYSNVVKDEYIYTIIDIPKDREIPSNYAEMVKEGVQAGLDSWGNINDIEFRHTDNRLEADIIIQQHIGDGRQFGNANIGCLFEQEQCTIQLFTDLNINGQQTLVSKQSIEFTIAHEFGHLIGLPHHIEPDNVMNTRHANNVREYYEVHNINVPKITEPKPEQRLLVYTQATNYTNSTSISDITKNEKFTEFTEYIRQILQNTPKDDREQLFKVIVLELTGKLYNIIFGQ